MRSIQILTALLTTLLIAPMTVLAASSEIVTSENADSAIAQRDILLADSRKEQDDDDEDHDEDHDKDHDDDDDDRLRDGKQKEQKIKGAEKKRLKDEAREARHEARNERHQDRDDAQKLRKGEHDARRTERHQEMDEHNERMRNAETPEERKAIAKSRAGDHRQDGKHRPDMESATEQQVEAEKMKAKTGARRGERDETVRDYQDEQKIVREERREQNAQNMEDYRKRLDSAKTAEERQVIQDEMKTARAGQQTERVEEQKTKKPWWRFWGD